MPEKELKDEQKRFTGLVTGALIQEIRQALAGVRGRLAASAAQEEEEANETFRLLKTRQFRAWAEQSPTIKERLPKIADEAKSRLEEARALETFRKQTLARLDKDLEELGRQWGRSA